MYRKLASAILVASAINAKYAFALGLGGITMHSALNQQLDAEIGITNVGELDNSQISISLASQEEFLKAGVERSFYLSDIKFVVTLDDKGNGVIKLRSSKLLNEPYLDMLIEARWPTGKLLRSYTVLVDLPTFSQSDAPAINLGSANGAPAKAQNSTAASSSTPVTNSQESSTANSNASVAQQSPAKPTSYLASPSASSSSSVRSAQSFDGNEYQVEKNDTLWKIALKIKPAGNVSVQQTMLAVQQLNENAFIGNNINRLKAGYVLRVPSYDDVAKISAQKASKDVSEQTSQWQGAQLDATTSSVPATKPKAVSDGHLTLTSAGSGSANGKDENGAAVGDLEKKLNASKESLEVSKLEKKELSTRVGSLTTQVDQLKRMVELKDAELANLQKQLNKQMELAKKTDLKSDVKDTKVEEVPVPESVPVVESAKPVDSLAEAPVVEEAKPALVEAPKVEAPKVEKPKEATKPIESPEASSSGIFQIIQDNPLYIGVAALIAFLFGVVGFILRRKAQSESKALNDTINFEFDDKEEQSNSMDYDSSDDNTGEMDVINEEVNSFDLDDVVSESDGYAEDDSRVSTPAETGDAIGEADIYIAYGRFDQAADLLLNAIKASPNNEELRSKLLDVFISSKNKAGFRSQYQDIQARGFTGLISQAKELLSTNDGVSDWLDNLATSESLNKFVNTSPDLEESEETIDYAVDSQSDLDSIEENDVHSDGQLDDSFDLDVDLSELDLDVSSDFDLEESSAPVQEEHLTDSEMDLDLSFDLPDTDEVVAESSKIAVDELDVGSNDLSLDMDEDFSLDLSDSLLDETTPETTEEDIATNELKDDENFDFSEDFGLDSESQVEAISGTEEKSDEDLSLESFDFSLDTPVDSVEVEDDLVEVESIEDASLDFSDIELDVTKNASDSSDQTIVRNAINLSFEDEHVDENIEEEQVLSVAEVDQEETFESLDESMDLSVNSDEMASFEDVPVSIVEEVPVPQAAPVAEEHHTSSPLAALEGTDLEFLTDSDEVSTKLDLAQAYIDMGDVDGARDILMEVMQEGKEAQKASATALLDSLE